MSWYLHIKISVLISKTVLGGRSILLLRISTTGWNAMMSEVYCNILWKKKERYKRERQGRRQNDEQSLSMLPMGSNFMIWIVSEQLWRGYHLLLFCFLTDFTPRALPNLSLRTSISSHFIHRVYPSICCTVVFTVYVEVKTHY